MSSPAVVDAPAAINIMISCVEAFGEAAATLDASFRTLLDCEPITFTNRPTKLPAAAVYLFSDGLTPIYVGRSNNLRARLAQHCRHGSQVNQASLAFRLACARVGYKRPKYQKGFSGAIALRTVAGLADAFASTKSELSLMPIRYVAEADQVKQLLLESYVALSLGTKHDFGTH